MIKAMTQMTQQAIQTHQQNQKKDKEESKRLRERNMTAAQRNFINKYLKA